MTQVTFDVADVAGSVAPGDSVTVWPPNVMATGSGRVQNTRRLTVRVDSGPETVDLEPGPLLVQLNCRGIADTGPKLGTVPEDGPATLADVLDGSWEYSPAVIQAAQLARNEARAAAQRADDAALVAEDASVAAGEARDEAVEKVDTALTNAAGLVRDEVKDDADRAVTAREGAESAESAAQGHREAAAGSASAAGASATTAGVHANAASASASAAAGSESAAAGSASAASAAAGGAGDSATAAAGSATAAASSASDASSYALDAAGSAQAASQSAAYVDQAVINAADSIRDGVAADADRAVQARDEAETMLDSKADLVGGFIPTSQIPAVALTKPVSVSSRADLLARQDVQEGDIGVITEGADMGTYMLGAGPADTWESWVPLATSPSAPVQSVNGQTGTVVLASSDVGAVPTTNLYSSAQPESTVYRRATTGTFDAGTPTSDAHVATKKYVDDGLAGKADSVHTHTSSQVDGLDAALARLGNVRAWFRGAGAPPASIPGAQVGDWWLDTSAMEIHEITGV